MYLAQIANCICPQLFNAFLSNCQMYLSQMNQHCIQGNLLFTLPLLPNSLSLSLSLWPSGLPIHIPTDIWACGPYNVGSQNWSQKKWVRPICQLHPNFKMYCVSHHVSGLRIWDACIFCPFGIKSFFTLAFEQIYANIVVEGCLTLLKNVSWDAFHKFPQIFILEIVNLLKECLVISDGAKSLLKVSLQKKGGWNTKILLQ